VVEEQGSQESVLSGVHENAYKRQRHHLQRQPERNQLIEKIIAAFGHAPGLVQRYFEGRKIPVQEIRIITSESACTPCRGTAASRL